MINFDELQETTALAANFTSNGQAYRAITTEQVIDALIMDAVERTAKLEIDEKSGIGRVASKQMCKLFLETGGEYTFFEWLAFKVAETKQRLKVASDIGDAKQINTRRQGAANYCFGIQTIMSTISRNSYYRKLEAERMEEAGHDRRTNRPNDYDGFQNVKFTPDQVIDAVESIKGPMLTYRGKKKGEKIDLGENLSSFYALFDRESDFSAMSQFLVAGRDFDVSTREWNHYLMVDEVWAGLERKRLDRMASLPTRDEAVAAM